MEKFLDFIEKIIYTIIFSMIFLSPLAVIWSLNTIFNLHIRYDFDTFFAMGVLLFVPACWFKWAIGPSKVTVSKEPLDKKDASTDVEG